ncbi:MAG: ATP-binding cassette domain-containing protein [Acidaminococcus sp.]|jgi:molybdate transport system ATP-binding protein|nr:ATP-binding cassette domain-containing protein [Acidaminococcus sp.]MCI2100428.1 ATP-binding cassette domain-containing protein [Acidaminococcus sp.]MCI2114749.1 ATP-binding cassette domain-containing protein [Acidaminococcus sp.]MCI2116831.1 ATP-binding cassette domain-containing protein [Acidaminococcus sp.]
MSLSVDIKLRLGAFHLAVQFETTQGPLALLGASGCGKSITLRCIAGIMTPDEGRILLDGTPLFDSKAGINIPPQKRHIGYLFQQYALFPTMTVEENIAAAIFSKKEQKERIPQLLEQFQLTKEAKKKPWQLSGGQQQRTALARIFASRPQALLLDEPFSALDSYLRGQVESQLFETLQNYSGSVIWVSHDLREVYRNCPEVCVIDQGQSQPQCTLPDLLKNPQTTAAAKLSGCQNIAKAEYENGKIKLPEWGITLQGNKRWAPSVHFIGFRAEHLYPAESPDDNNTFSCQILRIIRDIGKVTYQLKPLTAGPEARPLQMDLSDTQKQDYQTGDILKVAVNTENLLLLQ